MEFHERHIILSLEGLVGEGSILSKKSLLQQSVAVSKIKTFYQYKEELNDVMVDFNQSKPVINLQVYQYLIMQILYVLNFKKKFCSKNVNRLITNYFKIFYKSMRRKIGVSTIPKHIINDEIYLNTLAFSNIYVINESQKQ